MQERYKRNCGTFITEEHQNILLSKTFAVIGVGGNGGYIADFLARQGCKKLILVDFDNFETSNLNRQIFCNEENLYLNKAEQAILQLQKINSSIEYEYYCFPFGTKEIPSIKECDMIFAAADGNQYTEECREMLRNLIISGIPMIEQYNWEQGVSVSIITKDYLSLFDEQTKRWQYSASLPSLDISQPAWLCAIAASLAVAEAWKYFSNTDPLIGQRLLYDVYENKLHRFFAGKFVY